MLNYTVVSMSKLSYYNNCTVSCSDGNISSLRALAFTLGAWLVCFSQVTYRRRCNFFQIQINML